MPRALDSVRTVLSFWKKHNELGPLWHLRKGKRRSQGFTVDVAHLAEGFFDADCSGLTIETRVTSGITDEGKHYSDGK